jgi:hypothetical protein
LALSDADFRRNVPEAHRITQLVGVTNQPDREIARDREDATWPAHRSNEGGGEMLIATITRLTGVGNDLAHALGQARA